MFFACGSLDAHHNIQRSGLAGLNKLHTAILNSHGRGALSTGSRVSALTALVTYVLWLTS